MSLRKLTSFETLTNKKHFQFQVNAAVLKEQCSLIDVSTGIFDGAVNPQQQHLDGDEISLLSG